MRNQPRISVIVPCYNTAKHLPKCLDSLLSQTFQNFEIICVNDGSPDDTPAILRQYHKNYPHQVVVLNRPNQGVWCARQDGVKKARGEFVCFVDSDDYVQPNFLQDLHQAISTNKADIVVCGFARIDAETGDSFSYEMCTPEKTIDIYKSPDGLLNINTALWNKIYRADLLKSLPEFPHTPAILEDVMYLQLVYLNARKITFLPKSLYCYVIHPHSTTRSAIAPKTLETTYKAMTSIRQSYALSAPELIDYIDANAFLHLGVALMYRCAESDKAHFKSIFSKNLAVLNHCFPGWRHSPYLSLRYVISHHGQNFKLWIACQAYRARLARPALRIMTAIIARFAPDVSWW